jgi:hypothetical protein
MLPVQDVANRLHEIAQDLAKPEIGGKLDPYTHILPTNYKYEKGEALFRSLYANLLAQEGFSVSFEENCKKGCNTEKRDLVLRHEEFKNREIYLEFKVFAFGDFKVTGDLEKNNRIKLHRDVREKLYRCAHKHPEDFAFMGVVVFYSKDSKYANGRVKRSDSNFAVFLDKVELLYGVKKIVKPLILFGDETERPLTNVDGFNLDFLLLHVGIDEFKTLDGNNLKVSSVPKAHAYYLKMIRKGKINDKYTQVKKILTEREKQEAKEDLF